MPVTIEELSVDGQRILRTVYSGAVTQPDVQQVLDITRPGGPMRGIPILSIMEPSASLTAEARAVFSAPELQGDAGTTAIVAVVIPNLLMRVAVSFILRVTRVRRQKTFQDEREALEWLKHQMAAS